MQSKEAITMRAESKEYQTGGSYMRKKSLSLRAVPERMETVLP